VIRRVGELSPDTRALLEREAAIAPVAAAVRLRVLVRAGAALAAPAIPSVWSSVPWHARRIAVVATVCAIGAAAGAAAYEVRAKIDVESPQSPPFVPNVPEAPALTAAPPPVAPSVSHEGSGTATDELRLLQQARAAVARKDFEGALVPLGEHARRFEDGCLAEEREALRVKALSGLGRANEVRRAASAFVARFPQSVLVPAISGMAARP
jgi:hypothetical protein